MDLSQTTVIALLRSPRLGALQRLDLRQSQFGPEAARALAEAPALGSLSSLDLSDNMLELGEDDLRAIARSPALPRLERLVLLPPRIWGSAGEADLERLCQHDQPP